MFTRKLEETEKKLEPLQKIQLSVVIIANHVPQMGGPDHGNWLDFIDKVARRWPKKSV